MEGNWTPLHDIKYGNVFGSVHDNLLVTCLWFQNGNGWRIVDDAEGQIMHAVLPTFVNPHSTFPSRTSFCQFNLHCTGMDCQCEIKPGIPWICSTEARTYCYSLFCMVLRHIHTGSLRHKIYAHDPSFVIFVGWYSTFHRYSSGFLRWQHTIPPVPQKQLWNIGIYVEWTHFKMCTFHFMDTFCR